MTPLQEAFLSFVVVPVAVLFALLFIIRKVENYKTRQILEMDDAVDHDEWKTGEEDDVPVVVPIKRARSRRE